MSLALSIQAEFDKITSQLRNGTPSVRVVTRIAKLMLLHNVTTIVNGTVRWLRFQNLGLGVYEVTLADVSGAKKNLILKGKS